MRNKPESIAHLPLLPPSYEWRIICGQPQAWHGGGCFCHVHEDRDMDTVLAIVWNHWSNDSGLTRERYLDLLDFESRCHNGEECQACADREDDAIQTALEEALW